MPNLIGVHEATVPKPARSFPAPDCLSGTQAPSENRRHGQHTSKHAVSGRRRRTRHISPAPAGHRSPAPPRLRTRRGRSRRCGQHTRTTTRPRRCHPHSAHGTQPSPARSPHPDYGARPPRGGPDSFAATSRPPRPTDCLDLAAVVVQQALHDGIALHRLQRAEQPAAHRPALIGGESVHRVTAAAFAAARPGIWPGGLHQAPTASAGCAAMRAP